jgi:hypothetical protein
MTRPSARFLFAAGLLLGSCRYEPIAPSGPPSTARGDGGGDRMVAPDTGAGDAQPSGGDGAPAGSGDAGAGGEAAPSCGTSCSAEMSDGCCPGGCTAANDTDCAPRCGNGALEAGEQCDPPGSCPTACPNRACTRYRLEGSAAACNAICVESSQETACLPGDGCCPAGCTSGNDSDCLVVCGNGVKEASETCDPLASCPTSCPSQGCQLRKLVNGGTCAAQCVNDRQQTACASGDGCCPSGCNSTNDDDCAVACNNGVKEPGETCDPRSDCPTSCPPMGCQLRKLVGGGTCAAQCMNDKQQTACASGDGCCPGGCNNTNDKECAPKCGNGVVETGETCEVEECNRRQAACRSDANTIRTGKGSAAACSFACQESPRACGPGDGACPAGCGRDPDCLPRPSSCGHIEWCRKPFAPNQNLVICTTNDDARCTDAERAAECQREANTVCGTGHARPVIYSPPIGGAGSG